MAGRISRRSVAQYVAKRLLDGDETVVSQLAAYLIDNKRIKELDLYVHDIEIALQQNGVTVATITSARALADTTKREVTAYIKQMCGSTTVELRESVDPTLIGGIKLRTPSAEYDTSVRRRLTTLRKMKV